MYRERERERGDDASIIMMMLKMMLMMLMLLFRVVIMILEKEEEKVVHQNDMKWEQQMYTVKDPVYSVQSKAAGAVVHCTVYRGKNQVQPPRPRRSSPKLVIVSIFYFACFSLSSFFYFKLIVTELTYPVTRLCHMFQPK